MQPTAFKSVTIETDVHVEHACACMYTHRPTDRPIEKSEKEQRGFFSSKFSATEQLRAKAGIVQYCLTDDNLRLYRSSTYQLHTPLASIRAFILYYYVLLLLLYPYVSSSFVRPFVRSFVRPSTCLLLCLLAQPAKLSFSRDLYQRAQKARETLFLESALFIILIKAIVFIVV